jgi:hypothetical protein
VKILQVFRVETGLISAAARWFASLFLLTALLSAGADPVPVRFKQGSGHIFLLLRGDDGNTLAAGESFQTVKGSRVTTRTAFHFRDGSLDEETTVFDQSRNFSLLSDRRIQRGAAFPHPMEMQLDAQSGRVTFHDLEKDKTTSEVLKLPSDVANGIITQVLQNIAPDTSETQVSYVLPAAKPRLATLVISRAGEDTYLLGGRRETASRFEIKVDLGGVAGVIAPVIGKEPKPIYARMAGGTVPMFIRIETQFYEGAPVWTIEQTSPVWPSSEGK